MHVLGSCEASTQYLPINFFVNLFHSKNSNLPNCFSDLIHTEYRKLHKNNGHSPFVLPSIMRSSVGQCRNIRFRQLSASHVIITSAKDNNTYELIWSDSLEKMLNLTLNSEKMTAIFLSGEWVYLQGSNSTIFIFASLPSGDHFLKYLLLLRQTLSYKSNPIPSSGRPSASWEAHTKSQRCLPLKYGPRSPSPSWEADTKVAKVVSL